MRPLCVNVALLVFAAAVAASCSACSHGVRETALRSYALDLCKTMKHRNGAACRADVEANFPRCSEPFLEQRTTSEAFAECLGFELLPPASAPRVLAECASPRFRARVALSIARLSAWPSSTRHDVNGETFFVSSAPTITEKDVRVARLEDSDAGRMLIVDLEAAAAKKLEADTRDNVGEMMILSLNGAEMAIKIGSAIPGPKVSIGAEGMLPEEACQP